jgi:mannose-6-phosphate isomerase-like protein (cupin superfamily)
MPDFGALLGPALLSTSIDEVKARRGPPPWSERVVACEQFMLTVICQAPGHPNVSHFHIVDECWYVAEGEIIWTFDDEREVHAGPGDIVFAPRGSFHHIQPVGDETTIRIGIVLTDEPHRLERD